MDYGADEKEKVESRVGEGSKKSTNESSLKGFWGRISAMGVTRILIGGLAIGLLIGGAIGYNLRFLSIERQKPAAAEDQNLSDQIVPQGTGEHIETKTLTKEEIRERIKTFIANNLVRPGTSVVVGEITEEKGLYKLRITLSLGEQSQTVEAYATKDGTLFFPSALDISTSLPSPREEGQQQTGVDMERLVDDDPSKGPEDAPVIIVEFSDFQCPFCAKASLVVEEIVDTYRDKVRLVYRDFPLSSIHPNAQKAAEAAECANDQGKFWEYHDTIFANQGRLGVNSLKQYAKDLDLDTDQFDQCLDSGRYEAEVKKDLQDGIKLGVTSTPTFFINGKKIVGAQPFSTFEQVIERELGQTIEAG
ncbi:MAG: DsbA family protein [Candidatus Hydrothermarchaeales archaeon]